MPRTQRKPLRISKKATVPPMQTATTEPKEEIAAVAYAPTSTPVDGKVTATSSARTCTTEPMETVAPMATAATNLEADFKAEAQLLKNLFMIKPLLFEQVNICYLAPYQITP